MNRALVFMVLLGCGGATAEAPPPATGEGPGPEVAVSVRLLEGEPGVDDMPRTDASLALIHAQGRRDVRPLGQLEGVCSHEATDDAVILVRCWWAGAGTLLRVTRDRDALIVSRIPVDEMTGEGEAELVERVELPARAQLRPIGP